MLCQRAEIVLKSLSKRTAVRYTEIPGVFNFLSGGSKLDNIDDITASQDAVRAFLREQTSHRADIKFGEVICYSPYRYAIYASGNLLKLKDTWCRINIRMVDKFGKGRVFVAGGKSHHSSLSSLINVYYASRCRACP